MPWTEKQLKLFRAAAHNPDIAKRTGIKQSDAERMSKEGLKKMAGGGKAMINKQDTRHGKMDMPYTKLNRLAGFKKGGFMKKRRFNGEEESYVDDSAEPDVERKYFASGVSAKDREYTPPKAAAKKSKPTKSEAKSEDMVPKENTSRFEGGAKSGFRRAMPSSEQKERNARELAKEAGIAAIGGGYGKMLQGARSAQKAADFRRMATAKPTKSPSAAEIERRVNAGEYGFKKGGLMRDKKEIGKDQMDMAPYKKGGDMKESKAMMKKEIGFMQKKGAPASMIKHEKAEMKMARGGGVESRGKTKGTMIKMAAGGSVRAHGEHSIQKKGHTRGKMC